MGVHGKGASLESGRFAATAKSAKRKIGRRPAVKKAVSGIRKRALVQAAADEKVGWLTKESFATIKRLEKLLARKTAGADDAEAKAAREEAKGAQNRGELDGAIAILQAELARRDEVAAR